MLSQESLISKTIFKPEESAFDETIFCQSNGLLGVRSTLDFDSSYAQPGIFMRGEYGYGLSVPNQLVALPNWLDLKFIVNGTKINLEYTKVIDFKRELILLTGKNIIAYTVCDESGRKTSISIESVLSQKDKHIFASAIRICPINYSGEIAIECCINHRFGNNYHGGYWGNTVKSYHWNLVHFENTADGYKAEYKSISTTTQIEISTKLILSNYAQRSNIHEYLRHGEKITFCSKQGKAIYLERINTLYKKSPNAKVHFSMPQYHKLVQQNQQEWEKKWANFKYEVEAPSELVQGINFSTFQLHQAENIDAYGYNIPARGLTSEYHSGHFFFNTELYLVPFYAATNPDIARSLLISRLKTINNAIAATKAAGHPGLFWSEEVGMDGKPGGPTFLNDFIHGKITKEQTGEQVQHIACDVFYALRQYEAVTGDSSLMAEYGELLLTEALRYYSAIITYNSYEDIFELKNIMGIDEYHSSIDNNYYTLEMLRWLYSEGISYLKSKNQLYATEYAQWKNILKKLKHPNKIANVFEQFDGYFLLPSEEISAYMKNGLPEMRNELKKDAKNFQDVHTQLIKQCDVIMFMSMFPSKFSNAELYDNYMFYDIRTVHESSLSTTHAGIIAARIGKLEDAYRYLKISTRFNLDYTPRRHYNNGIHLAACAGGWLILMYGIAGLDYYRNILRVKPNLPHQIARLTFTYKFQGNLLQITITHERINIKLMEVGRYQIGILIHEKITYLTHVFDELEVNLNGEE